MKTLLNVAYGDMPWGNKEIEPPKRLATLNPDGSVTYKGITFSESDFARAIELHMKNFPEKYEIYSPFECSWCFCLGCFYADGEMTRFDEKNICLKTESDTLDLAGENKCENAEEILDWYLKNREFLEELVNSEWVRRNPSAI